MFWDGTLQLWLQSYTGTAPLSPTCKDAALVCPAVCEPTGWQTSWWPHTKMHLWKPALAWIVDFSGCCYTCTLAMCLFLSLVLIFSVDVLLYLRNFCVVPDFPQLKMISGSTPTTLSHFGLTQEVWALCLCLREVISLIWEPRQIFSC